MTNGDSSFKGTPFNSKESHRYSSPPPSLGTSNKLDKMPSCSPPPPPRRHYTTSRSVEDGSKELPDSAEHVLQEINNGRSILNRSPDNIFLINLRPARTSSNGFVLVSPTSPSPSPSPSHSQSLSSPTSAIGNSSEEMIDDVDMPRMPSLSLMRRPRPRCPLIVPSSSNRRIPSSRRRLPTADHFLPIQHHNEDE